MVKKFLEHSMKRNYKRTTQTEFNIENVAKKKGDKLYVKWKGYDNLLNRSIDKKHSTSII